MTVSSPSVLALIDPFVKGWPEHEDDRACVGTLHEVLTGRFETDVHFTAYTAAVERRHTSSSLARADEAGVQMVAAVFDVDGANHQATDEWWSGELEKLKPLLDKGAFVYRTRGGYRIVFKLQAPVPIQTAADAERWTQTYLAWCNYLEHEYDITADRRCKEWQRLYRAPHATREGEPLDLPTYGDSNGGLGVWWQINVDAWTDDEPADVPRERPSASTSLDTRRSAAAKMLGAAWPESGRHGAQLALAGALAHDGWPQDAAVEFLCAVCKEAGNEERPKREKTVRDTYKAKAEGRPIQGWTALGGYVDVGVLDGARRLLDPNADGLRELQQLLNKPTPRPEPADQTIGDELGVQWGGWDQPQQPPTYLLEGLIPEAKVVTFFAEGGSVKTWSALSLAIAVATGQPWLGTYPVKQGRALVLDYEDGGYEFHRRVRYLTGGRDIPDLGYRYGGPQIDSKEYWIELAEYVQKHEITLVIFDSISASMPGDADENSSGFAQGVKYAGRFTETGCTVVFIHHANKSGGIRGHSAVRDQSDVVFKFVPVSETDDCKRMRMECDKPGPQKRPLPVNVELTDEGLRTFKDEVAEVARNAFTDVDMKAAIRLALANGPVASIDHLRSATGKKQNVVEHTLKEMIQAGEVVKLGKRGYALDSDERRTARVLGELDSGKAFATITEISKHAFVDSLFVDELRLKGIICQSADGRWMRVERG